MNIKMPGINLTLSNMLNSTKERLERQEKRDNQIAFFEQQKVNLKEMKAGTIDEISRKLDLLHGYDAEILMAKTEYNHDQMFHIMDEAIERGEKIAEEAEKYAPKTPEERKEEIIEEATGIEKDEGLMSEIMDDLTEAVEEVSETEMKEMDSLTSSEETVKTVAEEMEELDRQALDSSIPEQYKRIDYRI